MTKLHEHYNKMKDISACCGVNLNLIKQQYTDKITKYIDSDIKKQRYHNSTKFHIDYFDINALYGDRAINVIQEAYTRKMGYRGWGCE